MNILLIAGQDYPHTYREFVTMFPNNEKKDKLIMYQIKGFISVKLDNSAPSFLLTPDHAYLSPCKCYVMGIPADLESGKDAKLFKLEDDKLPLGVKDELGWLSHLINIALAQKPVLLSLEADNNIVGFTFPAN